MKFFTDASKYPDPFATGYSFLIPNSKVRFSCNLPLETQIQTAEMAAIHNSLKTSLSPNTKNGCTDSLSSLQSLACTGICSKTFYILLLTKLLIHCLPCPKSRICSNMQQNELAEQLANEATSLIFKISFSKWKNPCTVRGRFRAEQYSIRRSYFYALQPTILAVLL